MNPLSLIPAPYQLLAKIIGIALLCFALLYAWHRFTNHYVEIGRQEVRQELQPKLEACETRYKTLSDQVSVQNEAISSWKNAAEINAHKAAEAIKTAQSISEYHQSTINAAKARAEASKDKSCDAAVADAMQDLMNLRK